MDTKLTKEKIQATSTYKQLEKEFGESILEELAKDLIQEWRIFEEHGNFYANAKNFCLNSELEYAHRAFSEIQYKKLFNLERKWRAGKVKLDIISSYTFDYYYTLIHECPFIEPITKNELAAYKEYLFELDGYPEYFNANLDHAKMVIAALQNTSDYPLWYRFYDKKFNTGDLLHLTDLVYEHELSCVSKHFEKHKSKSSEGFEKAAEEFQALISAYKTGDFSNIVISNKEKFLELAQVLDDKKYSLQLQDDIDNDNTTPELYVELAYDYLESLLFAVPPIKQNYENWQDAIYETAADHLKMQVIKHLDEVYEKYKVGKLNNYTEKERKKAKDEFDFWQGAYLDGKKKLEEE